ncbi:helix-turn-helix domain-containing protein [Kitasatospora aureofaciens]|uniref:winged helix-turn-helix domain-containing protein n=1 Tax=Kitasatospora aureofaciens TaxID=1894 RepID=UPI001C43CA50|nr:helix-turn-helix domain-containing protein [Kitasatospora aureofaciens]MBV6700369.1 helix-turn-helix domain-containing protein [Kitasatospora aureofaciens]
MVYRFHFTGADLARTRVADSVPPLEELSIALRVLRDRNQALRFGAWRREVRASLGPQARMVLDLTPVHGWVPAFLIPGGTGSVPELLEQVAATPRTQLRAALATIAQRQGLPGWAHRLGEDPEVLRRLVAALGEVHATVLAPYWPQVTACVAADRAIRSRQMLHGGVERLLSGLYPPRIRWRAPVLEVDLVSGLEGDVHLQGRGLLLMPSMFITQAPVVDPDAEPQPVLAYPAHHDATSGPASLLGARPAADDTPAPLSALLGRTRAAVLHIIAQRPGCTTGELADALTIAPSSASQHATVLREAGLTTTLRHRNTALHTPTPAGLALLEGCGPGVAHVRPCG